MNLRLLILTMATLLVLPFSTPATAMAEDRFLCEGSGKMLELSVYRETNQIRIKWADFDTTFKPRADYIKKYGPGWYMRVSGDVFEGASGLKIDFSTPSGLGTGILPGQPVTQIYSPENSIPLMTCMRAP